MADQNKNPWTTTSSKKIYSNDWINVREDQTINPSGGNSIYGVVEFKNLAIGIIPVDREGFTYLVGQYRYPLNEYSWEIPMGGGPKEEEKLMAAKRELLEETGLKAKNWKQILRIHTSNSVTDEEGFIFLATHLSQHQANPEESEELIVKRVPLQKAFDMCMDGRITDSLSLASLLKLSILISQGKIDLS